MQWSPRPTPTAVSVTFTISVYDSDGPITGGKLEYGDGSHESFFFPTTTQSQARSCIEGDQQMATLRHMYAAGGTYKARLTVYAGSCPGASLIVPGSKVVNYDVVIGERSAPAEPAAAS